MRPLAPLLDPLLALPLAKSPPGLSARRLRPWLAALVWVAASVGSAWAAWAADVPGGTPSIYTCTDDKGNRLTSDRPIAECRAKEQLLLNRDGSLRTVVPPTLTAEERAEREANERLAARSRAERADAVRRDKNLTSRFPDEAAHRKAREEALDTVRVAIKATEARVRDLASERKPLVEEAEFFKGKTLPGRLRQQLDANDATVEAQRSSAVNQSAELVRINKLYDQELGRLRKLWAGAAPGSLGPATPSTELAAAPAPATGLPRKASAPALPNMLVLPATGLKN